MRLVYGSAVAVALAMLAVPTANAQRMQMQDEAHAVKGGGIFAKGWTGKGDNGANVNDAKMTDEGGTFHVTTGPAVSYWNPANKASGDYTVKATFTEPKFMNLMSHPHPYGVFIGGNDLGTDQESLLYCEAYGSGKFIVRGFGPAAFKMNGGGEANEAVHKAAGQGEPVTQEVAMSVKGDKVSCSINGTEVASYDKAQVVAPGKLKSTDGIYGFRFAHNTEGTVTGFGMSKN
jgi:hypothetical protein